MYISVNDLPLYECSEEERILLFQKAGRQHPYSRPANAWVVVNGEGKCVEGFVSPTAEYNKESLKEDFLFRLGWAADLYEELEK